MPQADALAAVVVLAMKNAVAPLAAQLAELQLRIKACEDRPAVPGPPGADGQDGAPGAAGEKGADGLGFDDLSVALEDRTLTLAFRCGDRVKSFPVVLPFPKYQGTFSHGSHYDLGDVISHDGSAWHCQAPTAHPPRPGFAEWKLMVKSRNRP